MAQSKSILKTAKGTGIGLFIVKNLVQHHKRSIKVESSVGQGSRFIVSLPNNVQSVKSIGSPLTYDNELILTVSNHPKLPYSQLLESDDIETEKHHSILIAEDNEELREFIKELLQDECNIHEASNGKDAFEIACKEIPDVIVSDVLMPLVDGLQFCKQIKQDIHTCHIPFIMLTVLSSEKKHIEGLLKGADDYLTKPFHPDVLRIKIYNTIQTRLHINKQFNTKPAMEPTTMVSNDKDEVFLIKTIDAIKKQMGNPNLKVDLIIQEISMSRSPFFRKIKALTGSTPNDFIRTIRLKQSAQYLLESDMNVSEIAFEVGFFSAKYFRICFKNQFGLSPSEYIKHHSVTQKNNL